ncbi:MAG: M48 family metalloprotease [Alphaproteobacteria bacterium]|nr:M48 family metalloprotease [Alphaproteobacteria bacterium]
MRVRTVVALVLAGAMSGCTTQPAMPLDTITNASLAARSEISPEQRLRELIADEQRINTVFGRLVTSNVELCGERYVPSFGFRLWSLEDFDPPNRPAAIAAFGLGDRLQVYATAEGQPAWNAGVRAGDILAGIEGRDLAPGSAGRTQFAERVTEGLIKRGNVRFVFERAGKRHKLRLNALKSCPFAVTLAVGDDPNAATDGKSVYVTSGMLDFAPQDRDLAVVLGHEIAHAIAGHPQKLAPKPLKVERGIVGTMFDTAEGLGETAYSAVSGLAGARRNSIDFEMEADYVGLYLAARAGYDVSDAAEIWRRLEAEYPSTADGGWTHPSSEERFAAMRRTAEEIAARRADDQPLIPGKPGS